MEVLWRHIGATEAAVWKKEVPLPGVSESQGKTYSVPSEDTTNDLFCLYPSFI